MVQGVRPERALVLPRPFGLRCADAGPRPAGPRRIKHRPWAISRNYPTSKARLFEPVVINQTKLRCCRIVGLVRLPIELDLIDDFLAST